MSTSGAGANLKTKLMQDGSIVLKGSAIQIQGGESLTLHAGRVVTITAPQVLSK